MSLATLTKAGRAAIALALEWAGPDDSVLIAGKGHEDYQEIKGVKHHMDERELIADIIAGK